MDGDLSTSPREAVVARVRDVAATVAQDAGLDLVVLFGSLATGSRTHPEDIDLAVRTRSGIADLVALTNTFTAALRIQQVDLVDLRRADPLLMALIARDGLVMFERNDGAFAAFASLAARRFADTRKFREVEHQEVLDFIREWEERP